MARQTPQQKRANALHSRTIEKNMGRPASAYKKKDFQKSPLSNTMLFFMIFVVAGTMGLGFTEIGAALWSMISDLLIRFGVMTR